MMRRSTYIALALLIIISLTPPALAVDNQPRKIVTGWIPYYSIKTVLPFIKKLSTLPTPVADSPVTCEADEYSAEDIALLNSSYLFTNKDLMKEVMPFWFSIKSPTVIRNDYVTGNPSWPMEDTVCLIRRAGLQVIPTMTDGTDKLVLVGPYGNWSKDVIRTPYPHPMPGPEVHLSALGAALAGSFLQLPPPWTGPSLLLAGALLAWLLILATGQPVLRLVLLLLAGVGYATLTFFIQDRLSLVLPAVSPALTLLFGGIGCLGY
ncbi:MAG: CHASE2 domain-containing protein, partial [Actinobacteria bacterium]|nr:CHASE2 domain-containing protein [Actinomycetota bacterium]